MFLVKFNTFRSNKHLQSIYPLNEIHPNGKSIIYLFQLMNSGKNRLDGL